MNASERALPAVARLVDIHAWRRGAKWATRYLQHPLTGSTTWIEMDGTSIVHKMWNGRANLTEL